MSLNLEHLYFIAIVPPDNISGQITSYKQEVAEKYQSQQALRSPPHITLHMPFSWKEKKRERLEATLSDITESIRGFSIKLNGFDVFTPRVLFVNVERSEDLINCQRETTNAMKKLNVLNANYKDRTFHPHITLAFRDLKKPQFHQAWEEYKAKAYVEEFYVTKLCLLKHMQVQGSKPEWRVYKSFDFRG